MLTYLTSVLSWENRSFLEAGPYLFFTEEVSLSLAQGLGIKIE